MRVALLSAAPPNSLGSMAIYAEMVRTSVALASPDVELIIVPLLRHPLTGVRSRLAAIAEVRWRASRLQADVFHWLDGSHAYLAGGLPWARTLVTVHDFIPALQAAGAFQGIALPSWGARQLLSASIRATRHAGAVCAVSQATATDLQRFTGRSADAVVPLCLRPLPSPRPSSIELPCSYILHVGNHGFYKNRSAAQAVFAALAPIFPELHLVLAGAEESSPHSNPFAFAGLNERVHWFASPSDAMLVQLYKQAELLLFPSLYEGFGWPPLEAMAHGCPVVCSTAGSLPEVVGKAALTCSPTDIDGLTQAVTRLLQNPELKNDLIARGTSNLQRFSLHRMGSQLVSLYEKLDC